MTSKNCSPCCLLGNSCYSPWMWMKRRKQEAGYGFYISYQRQIEKTANAEITVLHKQLPCRQDLDFLEKVVLLYMHHVVRVLAPSLTKLLVVHKSWMANNVLSYNQLVLAQSSDSVSQGQWIWFTGVLLASAAFRHLGEDCRVDT